MLVNSVPLSLTTASGRPRLAMMSKVWPTFEEVDLAKQNLPATVKDATHRLSTQRIWLDSGFW
ncbi:hypothetical protein SAMN02745223_02938 [Devosia limi DSM 17137]|uniref:Uncharacterized protein n=1 Tax=Devosia limi DSM 17137 TaxID=1121477 RepID=A0A1M5CJB2_9HYPH|nr:hypothetical protein SAMN02745223_02938 [Devosia limi DSM 17137]